jgi:phi13 family phage major tail protein
MNKGVIIGMENLVFAKLLTDPDSGSATYDAVKKFAGSISAKVNPNSSMETLFADNGAYDTATTTGQVSLEINIADLPLDTQAEIFGHTLTAEGIMIRKSSDVPPWLAVGFKSLKSNGKYRYTWLAKGKFGLPEQSNETKGDSVSFQTPTVTGSFVKRECDDEWERHIDEDTAGYTAAQGTNWFNNPYGTA